MKKLNTILAALSVLAVLSFVNTVKAQQPTTEKKTTEKKADKKEVKKVPAKKATGKKDKTK
jgi:hypothetical protein